MPPSLSDNLAASQAPTATLKVWRVAAESAVVALGAWALYLPYFSQRTFLDEFDNMIGGNVVAHGGAIYVDFFSQHTPLAYWASAVGHLMGADHFGGQRLWGYLLFALLIGAVYARNVRAFGRAPLLAVAIGIPTFHAFNPELSYAVLSDNYQAIAYVAILFDVVAIGAMRDRTLSRWISLGLAGALAVGVAFVAVYYVAGAVLVAAVLSILNERKTPKSPSRWMGYIASRVGVFIAPFAAIAAALAATGALRGAYEQAFVLNREYYSKYLLGFGSDAITPFYSGLLDMTSRIVGLPAQAAANPLFALRDGLALAVIAAAVVVFFRVRMVLGVGMLWMAALCATRGWSGFHAQPLWAYVITCAAMIAWFVLRTPSARPVIRMATVTVLCALALTAITPYALMTWYGRATFLQPVGFPYPDRTRMIETLVPAGGSYGELDVNSAYDFVLTRRLPAGGFAGVVPWFGDMLDTQMADALAKDDPVLVFNPPTNDVWGYRVADHIPRVIALIERDYTEVDLSSVGIAPGVFIRTNALEDSLSKLRAAFPGADIQAVPSG